MLEISKFFSRLKMNATFNLKFLEKVDNFTVFYPYGKTHKGYKTTYDEINSFLSKAQLYYGLYVISAFLVIIFLFFIQYEFKLLISTILCILLALILLISLTYGIYTTKNEKTVFKNCVTIEQEQKHNINYKKLILEIFVAYILFFMILLLTLSGIAFLLKFIF